jgi:hypothetical protein
MQVLHDWQVGSHVVLGAGAFVTKSGRVGQPGIHPGFVLGVPTGEGVADEIGVLGGRIVEKAVGIVLVEAPRKWTW